MSVKDKRFYNQASAARLGWSPAWFCAEDFGELLVENVKDFQRKHNLAPDGLVGPMTYARICTEKEALHEMALDALTSKVDSDARYVVCGGQSIPIEWDKVVNFSDSDGLAAPESCYKFSRTVRKPNMIVTHWDATLSAKSCHNILTKRGVSSHFVIDNDGTIYQMLDTNHVAWHAGAVNKYSIGIDFSNAYYTKYQKYYRRKGHGNRPLIESVVHGVKLGAHLGYYPAQEEAYKALLKVLCMHYDIPLECPRDDSGRFVKGVHPSAKNGKFKGVVSHYHVSRNKIDCAGLEIDRLLGEIKKEQD